MVSTALPRITDEVEKLRNGESSGSDFVAEVRSCLSEDDFDRIGFLRYIESANVRELLTASESKALAEALVRQPVVHDMPGVFADAANGDKTELLQRDPGNQIDATLALQTGRVSPPPANDSAGNTEAEDSGDGYVLNGRFRLLEKIGEGGTSNVYRAIDLRKQEAGAHDVYVAVKLMLLQSGSRKKSLAMFQQEVQKTRTLVHPNIVRVYDFDRDDSIIFLTMEHLEGKTLEGDIKAGNIEAEQALDIIKSVAAALSYAHKHFFVHGDLKPGNIFILEDGSIKVIDFGIARAYGQAKDANAANESSAVWCTPAYAAPEIVTGANITPQFDVYALACIAYELLTHTHPYERLAGAMAHCQGMKVRRHESLTDRQYSALQRALEFEPEARTSSVDRFVEELTGEVAKPTSRQKPLRLAAATVAALAIAAAAVWMNKPAAEPPPDVVAEVPPPEPGETIQDCAVCPPLVALVATTPAGASVTTGIGKHEVTVGEYGAFINDSNYQPEPGCVAYDGDWASNEALGWNNPGFAQTSAHPVTCVSWNDAVAYTAWLSERTGNEYRLVNADEWERLALEPVDTALLCEHANVADQAAEKRYPGWTVAACDDRHVYTAPVASFAPTADGLHDTAGNVFEWIGDCGDQGCEQRQLRGGSWFSEPAFTLPDSINQFTANTRATTFGLRVARDLKQ